MEEMKSKIEHPPKAVEKLREIFDANKDKRVCIVGSSCVGKSTLLKYLPDSVDMDDILFGSKEKEIEPLLTKEEREYVCGPWTPEVGKFMTKRAHELIEIKAGNPVFGTIVFPSDLVIEVTVPDEILRERIIRRNANEIDVFNMKKQIEDEIKNSGIQSVVVENI